MMKYLSGFTIRVRFAATILLLAAGIIAPISGYAADQVREIQDNLIAPCCWSQPVSQHESEIAHQIRHEVSDMVAAGRSRDEILDHYVAKYGERILATPRARGFNVLAYVLPWIALLLGAWFLMALLKKLRTPSPIPAPASTPDPRYNSVVEREIRDLEE